MSPPLESTARTWVPTASKRAVPASASMGMQPPGRTFARAHSTRQALVAVRWIAVTRLRSWLGSSTTRARRWRAKMAQISFVVRASRRHCSCWGWCERLSPHPTYSMLMTAWVSPL
jgi:hypothetical protein